MKEKIVSRQEKTNLKRKKAQSKLNLIKATPRHAKFIDAFVDYCILLKKKSFNF